MRDVAGDGILGTHFCQSIAKRLCALQFISESVTLTYFGSIKNSIVNRQHCRDGYNFL